MPRQRPQLSITLPRNFTFHYTEGSEPKTPERDVPIPVPRSPRALPHAEGPYRIKRRSRPSVNSMLQNSRNTTRAEDIPIPSIENSTVNNAARPLFEQRATEPVEPYQPPLATRKFMTLPRTPEPHQLTRPALKFTTLPRTPEPQQRPRAHCWNDQQDIGESISRPMSTVSLLSDSSDESNGSLSSYPAGDGSCTSPESDSPDPFKFTSIKRGKAKHWVSLARNSETIQNGLSTKQIRVKWTSEMDKHLWSTYLVYLQDPTVTPFKMLPGVPPPLGICHRVAREARRSWRGGKMASRTPSGLLAPLAVTDELQKIDRPGSPDTIRPHRSGSNTPTDSAGQRMPLWPKSGGSTRRRLRYLSKRKPTIAPHYQRLLQSRSPSPFCSSSRPQTRSESRLSEVSSPTGPARSSSFSTRDIQMSLTTSTADTMQPDGPLAQLATDEDAISQPSREWFNEPPVPFASEIPIPSDFSNQSNNETVQVTSSVSTPRLGSPFGYHTWGPSRSRQRVRPSPPRIHSSDASTIGPSLRSPVRLHDTFPYPGIHKRRARHQLEDELSPGGSNMQENLLENVFGPPNEGRHRRVRSRGFSLGDVNDPNPLQSLFTPPSSDDPMTSPNMAQETRLVNMNPATPTTPTHQGRRLLSPFQGVTPRPIRRSPRHLATASLGAYNTNAFSSIGDTLGQADRNDQFHSPMQL